MVMAAMTGAGNVSAAVPAYTLVGTYSSAVSVGGGGGGGGGSTGPIGVAPDGRMYQVVGDGVYLQTAVNAAGFSLVGSLPVGSNDAFGAAFVAPSPDGSRLAIGNGKFGPGAGVHIVETASLSNGAPSGGTFVAVPNFSAAWGGSGAGGSLFVTGFGATSQVARVDLTPAAAATTVITSVGGASGGIAARGGELFVGAGFGAGVGDVRSFSVSGLNAAAASVAFSGGPLVVNAFTAGTIDFDASGNIILTGQSFTDANGVAVIDVAGGMRYDLPGLSPGDQYVAVFNNVTGEILVRGFGSSTVYRYAVPGPGGVGVLAIAGVFAARRRRS